MQKLAYAWMGMGAVALIILGIKEFFTDPEVDLLILIAVGAVGLGLLVLLGVVLRDRRRSSKDDRFKGVER